MNQPTPLQRSALELVAEGRFLPDIVREDDGWHARWRPVEGDNPWVDEIVRSSALTPLAADAEHQRHETLHDAWAAALRSRTGLVAWDDGECAAFAADLATWHGGVVGDEARKSLVFTFSAEEPSSFSVSCPVPRGRAVLKALGQATYVFGPLRGMKRNADGLLSVALSRQEAESFVLHGAGELASAGYSVEGCDISAQVTAAADVSDAVDPDGRGKGRGFVARLRIKVAGEEVTEQELRFLLDQGSSLVFFRNRWIEVDRSILKEAMRALTKSSGRRLSTCEAVAFAAGLGASGRLEMAEAAAHGWLRGLIGEMRGRAKGEAAHSAGLPPPGFSGELREYQRRGVAWLSFLTDNGFGALLADDMGLGKTVQAIAWMLCSRPAAKRPVLVAAPLTLLSNWRREIASFAPGLSVYVHQGGGRHASSGFVRAATSADVVLTSYQLLVRDFADISDVKWSALVLDEAQTVKNPDTQAARAVRALGVKRRVALTGTPVENSAMDIWSLEDFLNPGFLGDRKSFTERFARPMAMSPDGHAATRLRHALEPFVLRRLKGDAGVAAELGPKREIREYCSLSAAQRAEYESALADFRAGERRKGDVFALITRLKLACDGAGRVEGGGKFERLAELLESLFYAGESVLVFTQYAKVGEELREAIAGRFPVEVPFLHGGLSPAQRDREIAVFQRSRRPCAFVLSLRAGGYGLNLTKAAHVVHFDRWWNPAVENQATDRTHRIGQTRTVFSHLMISEGTIEERVDAILREKSRIAGAVVAGGEAFLAQMPLEELEGLAALDASGAAEGRRQ